MEEKEFVNMDDIITLTDEDGNDIDFEMLARCERNGQTYFAVIEVKDEHLDAAAKILKEEMESVAKLSVPLTVDVSSGKNWLEQE